MTEQAYIQTPLGVALLEGDTDGLQKVSVLDDANVAIDSVIPEILEDAAYQLGEYFEGKRDRFDLKLNPQGSEFQQKVWNALLEIPYGKRITYMDLAKRLGDPKAIRAVGVANGKNPLWIIVPCHRVVGAKGELTGYAGGLHRKAWLLEHESPNKQQSLF
ncbi:methylated-DNA--[protein]-cysteine S-methyltransferase [Sediminicola luteus]|uniref:Methylated-DNA--protein-cysteine methyltransferase n=1 Tax=Sediminicola luteus TaxID=319238 RepID=A0A2A4GFB3_9FLAO|nr:methylated-DNA--[protein]-cysteine S-methyltransferase [Sediminicola luteus]PCE66475.1 cysteine methyltransferase [Sediminicola luteus]